METPDVREVVTGITAEVLGVDQADLRTTDALTDLPTFSSFRIVEIVERVEEELDTEVEASDLTPDNLSRLNTLIALFERTLRASGVPG
ncbi:phosphopantetheine-binding protein [Streptomyces massasporeus]|jgi:acyl carrier protein|uniref:phosphopantetheine-binding protein n=1 Tax=Streptomyces massasporeus TaxID=67324 RepID=UPI0033C0A0B5